ncbi:MAG TPA: hypothetical protein VFC06_02175, partial [Demequina sp.]|nr:hypothetical protein [Demequina sp.]
RATPRALAQRPALPRNFEQLATPVVAHFRIGVAKERIQPRFWFPNRQLAPSMRLGMLIEGSNRPKPGSSALRGRIRRFHERSVDSLGCVEARAHVSVFSRECSLQNPPRVLPGG